MNLLPDGILCYHSAQKGKEHVTLWKEREAEDKARRTLALKKAKGNGTGDTGIRDREIPRSTLPCLHLVELRIPAP
jgi:hypothetical protein